MEKWYISAKKADFEAWGKELNINPVLARILRNRDITTVEEGRRFLYGSLEDCHSPWLMKDMDRAVDIILDSIDRGLKIRVMGDYDVDGICSSYMLTKGIQIMGGDADTVIPHRIHDGYGINDNLIEEAHKDLVSLIVTCDNGISAYEQIKKANELGIKVVVTDHHEVPFNDLKEEIIPPAMAVVDPKQAQCEYPFKSICGGVVVYKLMQAICEKTQNPGLKKAMSEFTEFAALSTVCDVMELVDENRILVKEGLRIMADSNNQGLKALMEVNELDSKKLSAYHLGFIIGPCLNATGRLDSANRALELLQSMTKVDAMGAAKELKDLNDSRKNLTLQGVAEAFKYIEENDMANDKVLVIFLPNVHESLAGIIAGRVREQTNKPCFVLTGAEEGVKGSGRSTDCYNMYESMSEVKDLFTKFGGHKLAAGLSMKAENVDTFRKAINDRCTLKDEDFMPKVHIDVPMPLSYATQKLAEELNLLEPFGVGNPKPLFAQKDLIFKSGVKIGKTKSFARFLVSTPDGRNEPLLFFGNLDDFSVFLDDKYGVGSSENLYLGKGDYKVSVVYQLGLNTYKGKTTTQFIMQNYC